MKHYLMRHPAIACDGYCLGQTDVPLSAPGQASIYALTQSIVDLNPDLIISSDLNRCRILAEAAASQLSCPLHVDVRWRELNFGAWENQKWEEIRDSDLVFFERWVQNFTHLAPPQGESFQDLLERIDHAIADLSENQTVLVITHAGCLRALAVRFHLISSAQMFDWPVPYGAIFSFDPTTLELHRHEPQRPTVYS